MREISKELFEEVFEGCNFGNYDANEELIYYSQPCNIFNGSWVNSEVSIFLFYFECKEWAFKNGFEIVVLAHKITIYKNGFEVYYKDTALYDLGMFFKACEWIYKEINK